MARASAGFAPAGMFRARTLPPCDQLAERRQPAPESRHGPDIRIFSMVDGIVIHVFR